jgi:hypothetical protein
MFLGNNVSWFAHLWETWLGNNVSWFVQGINYFADLKMTFRQNFFFKIGLETNLE